MTRPMKIRKPFVTRQLQAALLAFTALAPAVPMRGQSPRAAPSPAAALPGLPRPDVYEALRGDPANNSGYFFSVSPDEEWIAVMLHGRSAPLLCVRVLHRQSQKTWDAPLADWDFKGFPDCFSRDSRRIVLTGRVAELGASMRALEFTDLADGTAPPCTLLGFPAVGGDQAMEWGTVASNGEGTTYESLTEGQVETSVLRITPPGRSQKVDFSPLLDVDRERLDAAAAKVPPEMARLLQDQAKEPAIVQLEQLAVSPDGKCLAAVATIYRGQVGFAGRPYGVLVPLDHGHLVAHPFAQCVYGKILWSGDSKAVYYYAQPQVGTGNGTVHRQVVAGMVRRKGTPAEPARSGR